MSRPRTPYAHLVDRLGRDPAAPLITDLDLGSGERIELSVASAANGAAKAAHLVGDLSDNLGRPATVDLRLPLHWQVVTLALGIWAAGGRVVTAGPDAARVEVDAVVLGPADSAHLPDDLPDTVWATRLHAFGLPLSKPPSYPVEDLSGLLRAQADVPPPDRARPDTECLVVDQPHWSTETTAMLMARAGALAVELEPTGRVLTALRLSTRDAWVAAAVLPCLEAHSVLLVRGLEGRPELGEELRRVCSTERVAATCGVDVPGIPRLI